MLTVPQLGFLARARHGHLATADRTGAPHLVPVCFAVALRDEAASAYVTVDEKPKRTDIPLKRVRNILENPQVALTADRWDEDWTRLAWIMLRGPADILADGAEHDDAQRLLREKYPQYRRMDLAPLPVIALRIARVLAWGDLGPPV